MEVPKNLKVKIGTKEEAYWHRVVAETKLKISDFENILKFEREVLKMAKDRELLGKRG